MELYHKKMPCIPIAITSGIRTGKKRVGCAFAICNLQFLIYMLFFPYHLGMRLRTHITTLTLFAALLASCVLVFGAPATAVAAGAAENSYQGHSMPMPKQAACNQSGCIAEHNACENHCFDSAPEKNTPSALVSVRAEQAPVCPLVILAREHPDCPDIFFESQPRALPAPELLRSVIKRE